MLNAMILTKLFKILPYHCYLPPSLSPLITHTYSDHFSHHFHSLKQELLAAKTSRESSQLIRELCSACQKYFAVKRLFWEVSSQQFYRNMFVGLYYTTWRHYTCHLVCYRVQNWSTISSMFSNTCHLKLQQSKCLQN